MGNLLDFGEEEVIKGIFLGWDNEVWVDEDDDDNW